MNLTMVMHHFTLKNNSCHFTLENNNSPKTKPMKQFFFIAIATLAMSYNVIAQVNQYSPGCSTPDLDSVTAKALPYYNNNQFLENYLIQKGYNNLPVISFPATPNARAGTFLQPMFFVPLNIYIYRDGANNPISSINEVQARDYVCRVNEIFLNAGTAIQFYTNRVEFEVNNFFNQSINSDLTVYDLWSRKRYIPDPSKGINVHFIRNNVSPEDNLGKASLPHYPVPPYAQYSLYVRTHFNGTYSRLSDIEVSSTLAHEIGHTLGLLHTHHPGRLQSLIFNQTNATISNDCLQESVSRGKRNYWYNGCLSTDNMKKCEINGDFLCDTDADPSQLSRVSGCAYVYPASGDYRTDNWGDLWTPPTHNVMSYSTNDCQNQFSRHQTAIMWKQMEDFKTYITYQPPTISSSSDLICFGSNTSFTLTGSQLPTDATFNWEVQPANIVNIQNSTGSTAYLSATNNSSNQAVNVILSIVGPGSCYLARLQKTVWVGVPPANNSTLIWTTIRGENPITVGTGSFISYQVDYVPYADSYTWTFPPGFIVYGGSKTTSSPYISATTGNQTGTFTLYCRANNACRYSYTKSLTINVTSDGGGGIQMRMAFPNPANETITVKIKEEDGNEEAQVSLFNKNLEKVFFTHTKEKEITISTVDLPNGLYYLNVKMGKEVTQKQVIISH